MTELPFPQALVSITEEGVLTLKL